MKAKIKILLDEYASYYTALLITEVLIKALKTLPPETKLEPKFSRVGPGMPPVRIEMTIKERVEELERDRKILSARTETYKKELEQTSEGAKALKDWEDGKREQPKTQPAGQEKK